MYIKHVPATRWQPDESELIYEKEEIADAFALAMFDENGFVWHVTVKDDKTDEDIDLDLEDFVGKENFEKIRDWFEDKGDEYMHGVKEIETMLKEFL